MSDECFWDVQLNSLGLINPILISKNSIDPGRRVYLYKNHIYKIVLKSVQLTAHMRNQDLFGEYRILKKLRHLSGVPNVVNYIENNEVQVLIEEYFKGVPLDKANTNSIIFIRLLIKLMFVLFRLSASGVSHNDLNQKNVLINNNSNILLIDFDQATISNFFIAIYANYLGLGIKEVHCSLASIVKKRAENFLKKLFLHLTKKVVRFDNIEQKQIISKIFPEHIIPLVSAWEIAEKSYASSPGKKLAYYSLNVDGFCLPGERPWLDRWNMLKDILDYRNRSILELGCNLSLLSCFLLKEKSASLAVAVDKDKDILCAARLVANYYDVEINYECIDFDRDLNWEDLLLKFKPDLVFSLNIFNWVNDKERFMNFLKNFVELIYEGHDGLEIETLRLNKIGFNNIKVVSISERKREILYCKKY